MSNPEHSEYCKCECPQGLSYDKLERTLNRVRMLHVKTLNKDEEVCGGCYAYYPCDTMRALAGEDNDA
jgi:hypothetical protein